MLLALTCGGARGSSRERGQECSREAAACQESQDKRHTTSRRAHDHDGDGDGDDTTNVWKRHCSYYLLLLWWCQP